MNEQTLKALYSKIEELTKKEAIEWRYDDRSSFTVSFSRSTIEITQDYNYAPEIYHLDIRNEDGVIIAYISDGELDDREYGAPGIVYLERNVESLFRIIEKYVFKHDLTENSLFEDLGKLETTHPIREPSGKESESKSKS